MQVLAPERDLALLCATNDFRDGAAEAACLDLLVQISEDPSISGPLPGE